MPSLLFLFVILLVYFFVSFLVFPTSKLSVYYGFLYLSILVLTSIAQSIFKNSLLVVLIIPICLTMHTKTEQLFRQKFSTITYVNFIHKFILPLQVLSFIVYLSVTEGAKIDLSFLNFYWYGFSIIMFAIPFTLEALHNSLTVLVKIKRQPQFTLKRT